MPVVTCFLQGKAQLRKPTLRDRVFQIWFRLRRSATLGVRGIVVDGEGRVLLVRHTYTPGWHFPGGGVEKLETCRLSMQRELVEEAGIEAKAEDIELVSVHANHAFFPNDHVLVYRITRWTQGKATSRGEIAEVRFVDPTKPPEGVSPGTSRRLEELFGGKARSELW
jgi:8-oxo-dGTP pyrophosphatase MutT (NUDIX family)